ncbi:MAG: alpha/beta hydrolase, partial [Smithellaceae bacterium]
MLKYFNVKDNKVACWINPRDFGVHEKSLVFIHGSGSNSSVWSHQYAKLHKNYNVAAVNLPGHGKSPGSGERDARDYAHRLKDILESLELAKPVLIGHSLGAATVLCFAAQYPGDVSGVISVGGGMTIPVNPAIREGLSKDPEGIRDLIAKLSIAKASRPKLLAPVRASLAGVRTEVLFNDLTAC